MAEDIGVYPRRENSVEATSSGMPARGRSSIRGSMQSPARTISGPRSSQNSRITGCGCGVRFADVSGPPWNISRTRRSAGAERGKENALASTASGGGPEAWLVGPDGMPNRPTTLREVALWFPCVSSWVVACHARSVTCAVEDFKFAPCHFPWKIRRDFESRSAWERQLGAVSDGPARRVSESRQSHSGWMGVWFAWARELRISMDLVPPKTHCIQAFCMERMGAPRGMFPGGCGRGGLVADPPQREAGAHASERGRLSRRRAPDVKGPMGRAWRAVMKAGARVVPARVAHHGSPGAQVQTGGARGGRALVAGSGRGQSSGTEARCACAAEVRVYVPERTCHDMAMSEVEHQATSSASRAAAPALLRFGLPVAVR